MGGDHKAKSSRLWSKCSSAIAGSSGKISTRETFSGKSERQTGYFLNMVLVYRFKKEKLHDGGFVSRPRIPIVLHGEKSSVTVAALIDSGCDITVIPYDLAQAIGLKLEGEKSVLFAFRESTEVIHSKVGITFMGKVQREEAYLAHIPVLIPAANNLLEEEGVVLGIEGIFNAFDIHFKKSENKIILKKVHLKIG